MKIKILVIALLSLVYVSCNQGKHKKSHKTEVESHEGHNHDEHDHEGHNH